MDEFKQQLNNRMNAPVEESQSFDMYKNSKKYKFNQKLRWLTPKKKILYFLVVPVLLVAIGTLIYMGVAAPGSGNPYMWLRLNDSTLDTASLDCGQSYDIDIMVNADGVNPGVIVAGAYLYYNPQYITVNSIDTSASVFDIGEEGNGTLQFIDSGNSLVQVIRGRVTPLTTQSNVLLATINVTVKTGITSTASAIRFYDEGDLTSMFILSDETAVDSVYDNSYTSGKDGVYNIALSCETNEEPTVEIPEGGAAIFFKKDFDTVELGDSFTVDLMMRPDLSDIGSIRGYVVSDPANALSINGSSSYLFDFNPLNGTDAIERRLATLNIVANQQGLATLKIDSLEFTGVDEDKIVTDVGEYLVSMPDIKLCSGTNIIAEEIGRDLVVTFCTEPTSQCSMEVFDNGGSSEGTDSDSFSVENHEMEVYIGSGNAKPYTYNIVCNRSQYGQYTYEGIFNPSTESNLTISLAPRATNIGPTTADITWTTQGGEKGNGLSTSQVFYRLQGSSGYSSTVMNNNFTSVHEVSIYGLQDDAQYEYYVVSSTDGSTCGMATTNSSTCTASVRKTFATPDLDLSPDSNILLKVNRDRVCDEWLYCSASLEVTDAKTGKNEDVCFSVGLCGEMNADGQCIDIIDPPVVNNTIDVTDITKATSELNSIKYLSGYSKVGADWGWRCVSTGLACIGQNDTSCASECVLAQVEGLRNYSVMNEVGLPVYIANSSFEEGTERPWVSYRNGSVQVVTTDGDNKALAIQPDLNTAHSGAVIKEVASDMQAGGEYIISFRAKSSNYKGQRIEVELVHDGTLEKFAYYNGITSTSTITLDNYWQEYILTIDGKMPASSNPIDLLFVQYDAQTIDTFYIDDVIMKSVLEIGDNQDYVARSCRMYPTQSAPACDYYDTQSGKEYQGWKGYCAETDPAYTGVNSLPMCLQWWPVDIIEGESNVFSDDTVVGYTGRTPLYYCIEAAGNYQINVSSTIPTVGYKSDKYQLESYIKSDSISSDCKNGPGDADYTFFICQDEFSSKGYKTIELNDLGGALAFGSSRQAPEYGLREYEVEAIELDAVDLGFRYPKNIVIDRTKFGKQETIAGITYNFSRHVDTSGNVEWKIEPDAVKDETNRIAFIARFDAYKGLTEISYNGADDTDEKHEGEAYIVRYYLREPCLKIAQAITIDGEGIPRGQRLDSDSIQDPNWIGYTNDQDYAPFGGAVVSGLDWNPEEWIIGSETGNEPLMIEQPNTNMTAPYQIRAGSPYGATDSLSVFGQSVCISGSNVGASCSSQTDCGIDYETGKTGKCIGFDLPGDTESWVDFNNFISTNSDGATNLQELFVVSQGIWEWSNTDKKYIKQPSTEDWDIASTSGVDPKIPHILVDDKEDRIARVYSQGPVVLKFSSWVQEDQRPLVAYSVDWGDGEVSAEYGLRIEGKTINDPHILVHYYEFKGKDCTNYVDVSASNPVAYCWFRPTITIEDNWGKKAIRSFGQFEDSSGNLYPNPDVEIRVYENIPANEEARLGVDSVTLNFYDDKNSTLYEWPHTEKFTISNLIPFGENLNWKIEDFGVDSIFNNIKYSMSPDFGNSGTLAPGESIDVTLTVESIYNLPGAFDLPDGNTFIENIVVTNIDDATQEKSVEVVVKGVPTFDVYQLNNIGGVYEYDYEPTLIFHHDGSRITDNGQVVYIANHEIEDKQLSLSYNYDTFWINISTDVNITTEPATGKDDIRRYEYKINVSDNLEEYAGVYEDVIEIREANATDSYGAEIHIIPIRVIVN